MRIEFTYKAHVGCNVQIIADFTDWKPISMIDVSNTGNYSITFDSITGTHQYKFIVDGEYILDPCNPKTIPCPFGYNNLVHVAEKEVCNHDTFLSKEMNEMGKTTKGYSVAVVATMSAGKSTLLNSMLGDKILPSKNEACTAKVYSIIDNDDAEEFTARKIQNGVAGEWKTASREILQEYNNSSAERIEICGNIKQIRNMNSGHAVLFYDTPGPNNSRDLSHSEITKEIIHDSTFCSLICVLNATQLGTYDEFELLTFIRSEIEKKNSTSDVLFVLNKVDLFDLAAGESIRNSLTICKKHLRDRIGFQKITLLPVSSQFALQVRMFLSSVEPMSTTELEDFSCKKKSAKDKFLKSKLPDDDQIELGKILRKILRHKRTYASALQFSPTMKTIFLHMKDKINKAKKIQEHVLIAKRLYNMQDLQYALLLSGVPIVEQYLENKLKKASK